MWKKKILTPFPRPLRDLQVRIPRKCEHHHGKILCRLAPDRDGGKITCKVLPAVRPIHQSLFRYLALPPAFLPSHFLYADSWSSISSPECCMTCRTVAEVGKESGVYRAQCRGLKVGSIRTRIWRNVRLSRSGCVPSTRRWKASRCRRL